MRCFYVFLAFLLGCAPGSKSAPSDGFERSAMLKNLAENVIYPAVQEASTDATALTGAVQGYCSALATPGEAAARQQAREAWKRAMASWQIVEVMQIGIAADNGGALRDEIYGWPVASSCAVDQDVMLRRAQPDSFDISMRLINRRSLTALEYLLFAPTLEHTCADNAAPPGWQELSGAERVAARCGFAIEVAADVGKRTAMVESAWDPKQGNFTGALAVAGTGGSSFARAQDAVNVVSDAMFYLDQITKDKKLAEPTGIAINRCGNGGVICPAELESQYAHVSKENIEQNLVGFRRLFLGNDAEDRPGVGFDDFLDQLGAGTLRATMVADLEGALAALRAIPGTLDAALLDSPEQVLELHARVKAVCDQMKSQFLTVLGLEIPNGAAGDND